jgi:hypothetical protein
LECDAFDPAAFVEEFAVVDALIFVGARLRLDALELVELALAMWAASVFFV